MSYLGVLETHALRYWLWFKGLVQRRKAEPWLALLGFAESFLIPLPVDPFLAAMVLADRTRWAWVAAIATLSSTAGAVAGYAIGFFAFDYLGTYFAAVTDRSEFVSKMAFLFEDHATVLSFAAALTPIPNAPVVIAAGFLSANLLFFTCAWLVARAIRFFGVAYIMYAFNAEALSRAERALNIGTVLFVLIALGWAVWRVAGI